jgi:hypothetical protein
VERGVRIGRQGASAGDIGDMTAMGCDRCRRWVCSQPRRLKTASPIGRLYFFDDPLIYTMTPFIDRCAFDSFGKKPTNRHLPNL